jgi:cytochrome c oxidase assembly protein subunit 15
MTMVGLRRATLTALVLTYGLIVLGALVRATGSGLSCPDWPTCYGHWVPLPGEIPPQAGYSYLQVMLEWVHRLVAGVMLGPLILVIGWLCWRARSQMPRMPAYALVLLVLLLVQGLLGGVTVLDQNSPWSVALHLTTALVLFSVLWLIHERAGPTSRAPARPIRLLSVVVWLLALGAMASAAMTTKSGASLACSTWPLCDGLIIPDLADPAIRLHIAHRWFAAGTALGVLALFLMSSGQAAIERLAGGALLLILCQIGLGALVIVLEVPVWTAVAHQALGVLTFALIARLMWRSLGKARHSPDMAGASFRGEPA